MTKNDKHLLEAIGETPSDLVFWSFRYFLGRRSIHASAFASKLAFVWPFVDSRVRDLIRREIEEELARYEKTMGESFPLREEWQAVLNSSKAAV